MDLEAFVARLALNPAFAEEFLNAPGAKAEEEDIEVNDGDLETLVAVAELLHDAGDMGGNVPDDGPD